MKNFLTNQIKSNDISVLLLLYKTSKSVLKNLKNYKDFKVYILDQSNDHQLKKKIIKILPKIQLYKITNENRGFAWGINFLTKKIKSRFFLCTQADVVISKKSILRLKKPFLIKKDTIISIPLIKNFKNFNLANNKGDKLVKVNKMIGAIFLSEKDKFNRIGKFDENFFFYWEDMDLSKRIENSKYNLYLNPMSKANHLGGQSTTQEYRNLFIKNLNFKFGEYLYQYKYNELRIVKISRELIKIPILSLFCFITLQFKSSFKMLCYYLGILKFINFIILNK